MRKSFAWMAVASAALASGPAAAAITVAEDPVLFWNDLAISRIGPSPLQSRTLAVMNIAMQDAANRTANRANNTI